MVFVSGGNVAMVEARATYHGREVENTLYFRHDGPMDATSVQDLVDSITIGWLLSLRAVTVPEYSMDEWYVTDLTSGTAPTYSITESPPLLGLDTSNPGMPGSIAMCVSFRTAGRGKSARGRNYVMGMTENNVTANALSTPYINAVIAAYEELLPGGGVDPDWTWGVFSRYTNNAPRMTGLFQPITSVISTDPTVDSQRGRLR